MIKLPSMSFILPEWRESDFYQVRYAEKKLAKISSNAGAGSDAFLEACERLKRVANKSEVVDLYSVISMPIDVRACTYLLASDDEFSNSVPVSNALLSTLLIPRNPLSKLSLMQLIRAFFSRFDVVAKNERLSDWAEFLRQQLSLLSISKDGGELAVYKDNATILFHPTGPANVVKYTQEKDIDFDNAIKELALSAYSDSRFLTLCRYQYYLDTLKDIELGEDHEVLAEIVKKEVAEAPYSETRQLGHVALEILIDRASGSVISQAWQNTILTIAGDPRVPNTSRNYQRWWQILGEDRQAVVRGWLSRFDLRLFLEVLEQSAREGGEYDIDRMFQPRKKFLEGMLGLGIVTDSRLFLSNMAEQYLLRNYKKSELPEYARIKTGQTSMIYVNLENKIHMVEGSHSFKIKVFKRLPSKPPITDYGVKLFTDSGLRSYMEHSYYKEFGVDDYLSQTHADLVWQNAVIEFCRDNGVDIPAAEVIRESAYRTYKTRFGA